MGTAAAVAVLIRKEKEMVAAFRDAGATSAESAKSLDELNVHDGAAFRRLRARAVLRESSPGRFYVDHESWEALRGMRRRVATVMLVVVAFLVAVGFIKFR